MLASSSQSSKKSSSLSSKPASTSSHEGHASSSTASTSAQEGHAAGEVSEESSRLHLKAENLPPASGAGAQTRVPASRSSSSRSSTKLGLSPQAMRPRWTSCRMSRFVTQTRPLGRQVQTLRFFPGSQTVTSYSDPCASLHFPTNESKG